MGTSPVIIPRRRPDLAVQWPLPRVAAILGPRPWGQGHVEIGDKEVRISVRGLTRGMFVSRLDRPWLETNFPLQGLRLDSDDQVLALMRICAHVWIDTHAGAAPDLRHLAPLPAVPRNREVRESPELKRLYRHDWQLEAQVEDELPRAETAHVALKALVTEVMGDLRKGRRLDLDQLRAGVQAMIDSVLRNPAALAWLKELKRRDDYTYHRAMGSSIWAASFGRHLGLIREELEDLALGGLLCDVGKACLPPELLAKKTPLNADEAILVRRHVQHSLDIVTCTPGASTRVIEIVATHHERHDGSGYPHALRGDQIPIFGRIMGVVDSYDAMTSVRPYAPSLSPHQAVAELYDQRDRQFQAEIVEQFIQACGIYPTGSLVELTSGEVGVVIEVHSLKRLRPRVMVLLDGDKQPLPEFRIVDLGTLDASAREPSLAVKCGLPLGAYGIDGDELFLG